LRSESALQGPTSSPRPALLRGRVRHPHRGSVVGRCVERVSELVGASRPGSLRIRLLRLVGDAAVAGPPDETTASSGLSRQPREEGRLMGPAWPDRGPAAAQAYDHARIFAELAAGNLQLRRRGRER
jgi:hypothetical protein